MKDFEVLFLLWRIQNRNTESFSKNSRCFKEYELMMEMKSWENDLWANQ